LDTSNALMSKPRGSLTVCGERLRVCACVRVCQCLVMLQQWHIRYTGTAELLRDALRAIGVARLWEVVRFDFLLPRN